MVLLYMRVISIGALMKGNSLKTERHLRNGFQVSMQGKSISVDKRDFYTEDPVRHMKVMLKIQVPVLEAALCVLEKLDANDQNSMDDLYLAGVESHETSLTELNSNTKSQANTSE